MASFTTDFDIGDTAVYAGNACTVLGVTIGSDRAVYYTVQWVAAQEEGCTTYASATVGAAAVTAAPSEQ